MSKFLPGLIFFAALSPLYAQPKRQFVVDPRDGTQRVSLHLSAKTGNYFIRPVHSQDILRVYSNQGPYASPYFLEESVQGELHNLSLELSGLTGRGLTRTISEQMLGATDDPEESERYWKIYLTDEKPYQLDLDYALGNADIDLSGLSVERLHLISGSSDVRLGFNHSINKVEMDTFLVKVDLGSLEVTHLPAARSRFVLAEVGFGKLELDFSDRPRNRYEVHGSVGAGNLIIDMPPDDIPVIVNITDSWLCTVEVPRTYHRISENTYANSSYSPNSPGPLVFNLDVAMGSILLRQRER